VRLGSITKVSVATVLLCFVGCQGHGTRRAPAIGRAFVGPSELNIRRDIALQSPTVATVKHGERLEILQQRRVFFRVRTPNGAEGWTSASQLLSASDMDALEQLAERAAKMPAQGEATTYDLLRVHAQPSARSPSFIQIQPQERFTVLAHVVVPRVELPRAPLIPPAPPKVLPPPKKAPKPAAKIPPPPMPRPPGLPENWQEISKPGLDEEDATEDEPEETEPEPAPQAIPEDDWSLIRTRSKQTGWVLTRRMSMAIPDEVAQYAEGRRIVTYFSLGTVQDGDAKKDIWLWTTTGAAHNPYDFESFRVFIWSLRRHRYETAYIERAIQGYEPVLLDRFAYAGGNTRGQPVKYPGFSICMRKQDGSLVRREYVLLTNIVRVAGERACELPAPVFVMPSTTKTAAPLSSEPKTAAPPAAEKRGIVERLKERWRGWWHRK